jgi:two-component system LytT family response regulator
MATKNGIVRNKVEVGKGPDLVRLRMEEILYLEGNGTYTFFHTKNKMILSAKNLGYWEGVLGDGFKRIHRKYLVNCVHIQLFNEKSVIMSSGIELEISRRRLTSVMK